MFQVIYGPTLKEVSNVQSQRNCPFNRFYLPIECVQGTSIMNNNQGYNSIIVERNPTEQELWEGNVYGMPPVIFCTLFSIVVVGIWTIGFILWNKFIKKSKW